MFNVFMFIWVSITLQGLMSGFTCTQQFFYFILSFYVPPHTHTHLLSLPPPRLSLVLSVILIPLKVLWWNTSSACWRSGDLTGNAYRHRILWNMKHVFILLWVHALFCVRVRACVHISTLNLKWINWSDTLTCQQEKHRCYNTNDNLVPCRCVSHVSEPEHHY